PVCRPYLCVCCVVFTATASTEIYTLSLHDALPISAGSSSDCVSTTVVPWGPLATSTSSTIACMSGSPRRPVANGGGMAGSGGGVDRKSTRLNSSHVKISYAVFCLKKKIRRTRGDRR